MPKDQSDGQGPFSAAQLRLAGTEFEVALAALERATIGAHYNQRQRDLLVILAEKFEAEIAGKTVEYMVKEKFEYNIAEHIGVSAGTIKNDLNAMGDLVHTPFINGGKRDKAYKLTEKGHALYHAYKTGKAQLILETADAIRGAGDGPKPGGAGGLLPMLVAACLLLGAASQVEASDAMSGVGSMLAYPVPDQADLYAMPFADLPCQDPARACSQAMTAAAMAMAAAPAAAIWTSGGASVIARWETVADRKSMFDEHLPKILLNTGSDGYPDLGIFR